MAGRSKSKRFTPPKQPTKSKMARGLFKKHGDDPKAHPMLAKAMKTKNSPVNSR